MNVGLHGEQLKRFFLEIEENIPLTITESVIR